MILVKIAMVGAAIALLMAVAQSQHWPARAGVVGSCRTTLAPASQPTGYWYACKEGVLTGFPVLEADSCMSAGFVAKEEYWGCTRPLDSIPGF
jgi:hypothetical protein